MNREVSADLVRIARVRDLDAATCRAARALHHAAFGDDAAFLERLFAAAAEERYLYIRAGSTVVAGCFVCDAVLHAGDVTLHGGYLYALCTAAAYRRRGFAHALLGAAVRCTDDFLLTVPGSRSLCDFYRRAGFTAALSGCVAVGGSGGSPAPADLQPGTYADAVRAARCGTADFSPRSASPRRIRSARRRSCAVKRLRRPTAFSRICCSKCEDFAKSKTGRRGADPYRLAKNCTYRTGGGLLPPRIGSHPPCTGKQHNYNITERMVFMVYILLADGFEEIEALCPLDLLRRAGIDAKTVSVTEKRVVTGSHGISVTADLTAENSLSDIEMLVLPGGMPGTTNLDKSQFCDGLLRAAAKNGAYIAAICAAPMVLGRRGLLAGREAVCYPGFEHELAGAKLSDRRVVRDGRIITGVGMGAALEFGLALVEIFCGKETAERIGGSVLAK